MKNLFIGICAILFIACNNETEIEKNDVHNLKEATFELSDDMSISLLKNVINGIETKGNTITKSMSPDFNVELAKNDYKIKNTEDYYRPSGTQGTLVKNFSTSYKQDTISVKYYNISNNGKIGYAIVLADKRFPSVLAYVPEGNIQDTIENKSLQHYFDILNYNIELNREEFYSNFDDNSIKGLVTELGQSTKSITVRSNTFIDPLLKTEWAQREPYNNDVKKVCGNGKAPLGCVITAISQIMAFNKKPSGYNYGLITSSNEIPDDGSAAAKEVARFCKYVQDNIAVTISCSGTGASDQSVLNGLRNMGYYQAKAADVLPTFNESDHCAANIIIADVRYGGRPVAVGGVNKKGVGHQWCVDGFYEYTTGGSLEPYSQTISPRLIVNKQFLVHINWGWGTGTFSNGLSNGYFQNTCYELNSNISGEIQIPYNNKMTVIYRIY